MEASALARRAPLGTLKPGHVSPMRAVPEHIERPEYMFHDGPERVTASDIKSPETIAKIREAGRIAAGAIEAVGAAIAPGVTTEELDRIGSIETSNPITFRNVPVGCTCTIIYGRTRGRGHR